VPEKEISLHGVVPLVLQVVSSQLLRQTDTPAFLAKVEYHSLPLLGDELHGSLKLLTAIAALGAEDVPGKALRVHPDHYLFLVVNIAVDQGEMLLVVHAVLVEHELVLAVLIGNSSGGNASY
jgi:hypothetical protein